MASSLPPVADTPNPAAPAAPVADPAAPAEPAVAKPVEPVVTKADPVVTKSEPVAPVKEPPKPDEPLFTLPEDFKPPESMVAKFTEVMKGKWVDGKLSLSPQEVVNLYYDNAKEANVLWQQQIEATDKANEAACKSRFSAEQLAAAETAVGWFSAFEPAFRDLSKRQLNDPVFTNAMRIVGELLSEDTFERGGTPPPAKRTAAQIMGYDKKQ